MDLSSSFEDIVLVNVRSKKTPELAAHMRQQLLHHFNTALTVVSNSLFLSYKLNQPAQKTIENLRHVYGRVESFEKILTTMEKNPSLLDYLLSLHLPESIPELSSSDQIPRFSPSS